MKELPILRVKAGFTLVELLVSMAILVVLMLILVSMTDAIRRTWTFTTGKIEQFRDAREAFESMTRKLSQATLNTYWDYQRDINGNPLTSGTNAYIRQSEFRFIVGNAQGNYAQGFLPLLSGTNYVTHAVFFQAPIGFVGSAAAYGGLKNLINTCGYFVQFGDDSAYRPGFITPATWPLRYRFRLMEMLEPSQSMTIYNYTSGVTRQGSLLNPTCTYQWFTDALAVTPLPTHPLAENVVALVLLPKLTPADEAAGSPAVYTDASLAPYYLYDSTGTNMTTTSDKNLDPINQLPPIVQVTMVAVDEASYGRFQSQYGSSIPSVLGLANLFTQPGDTLNPSNPGYAKDLRTLQGTLAAYGLTYRVFTSDVSLKAAKWSRFQQN